MTWLATVFFSGRVKKIMGVCVGLLALSGCVTKSSTSSQGSGQAAGSSWGVFRLWLYDRLDGNIPAQLRQCDMFLPHISVRLHPIEEGCKGADYRKDYTADADGRITTEQLPYPCTFNIEILPYNHAAAAPSMASWYRSNPTHGGQTIAGQYIGDTGKTLELVIQRDISAWAGVHAGPVPVEACTGIDSQKASRVDLNFAMGAVATCCSGLYPEARNTDKYDLGLSLAREGDLVSFCGSDFHTCGELFCAPRDRAQDWHKGVAIYRDCCGKESLMGNRFDWDRNKPYSAQCKAILTYYGYEAPATPPLDPAACVVQPESQSFDACVARCGTCSNCSCDEGCAGAFGYQRGQTHGCQAWSNECMVNCRNKYNQ